MTLFSLDHGPMGQSSMKNLVLGPDKSLGKNKCLKGEFEHKNAPFQLFWIFLELTILICKFLRETAPWEKWPHGGSSQSVAYLQCHATTLKLTGADGRKGPPIESGWRSDYQCYIIIGHWGRWARQRQYRRTSWSWAVSSSVKLKLSQPLN